MAYKVLFQSNPAATTDTTVYTATGPFIIHTLYICNQSATTTALVRVAIRVAAAALSAPQYALYDVPVDPNFIGIVRGLTGGNTDLVVVRSSTANVSFTAYGDA